MAPTEPGRAYSKLPEPLDPAIRSLFNFCNEDKFGKLSDEKLASHITQVRDRAFKIAPWPCLGWFRFVPPPIRTGGVEKPNTYEKVTTHLRRHREAKILDFGCCFGHDARALVQDGVEPQQIVNADLLPELMNLGYELFGDSQDSKHLKGMRFEQADVFKEEDIKKLEVKEGYHAIYVGSFIHLFPLEHQRECVAVLDRLLAEFPGATIFGAQIGRIEGEAGVREEQGERGPTNVPADAKGNRQGIYVHDMTSLQNMFLDVTKKDWDLHAEKKERPIREGDGAPMMQKELASGEGQIRIHFALSRK